MSKKDPKLDTKYENDDPDFNPGTSSSSSLESRAQPSRNARKPSVSDKNEIDIQTLSDKSEIQKSSKTLKIPSHTDEISSSDSVLSHQSETNLQITSEQFIKEYHVSSSPSQFSSKETMAPPTIDPEMIRQIIQTVLSTQQETTKSVIPKVDLQKLTMRNYVDWAKKMKYALKLNKLWVEPTLLPSALQGEEINKNEKAVLFMACYLDDQNSSLINDSNEKCFISAWNNIRKFHEPRSATVLTDIHKQIQAIKHQPGQSIETHLMKLESQFTRFHDINKKLDDEHLVALILASVSDSPDFENVLHSAMWEDESTLTIAKVKSVLISTQRRLKTEKDEEAHHSKYKPQYKPTKSIKNSSQKQHNRRPRNPSAGWKCPDCEMDNHSRQNCFKKLQETHQQTRQGVTIQQKRAHQAEEETQDANVARAYAGRTHEPQQSTRHEPYRPVSIKNRLGDPVTPVSPYCNILPKRSNADVHTPRDDILDINFNPNYEFEEIDYGDISATECAENDELTKSSGKTTKTSYNKSISKLFPQNTITCESSSSPMFLRNCMNPFNMLNFKANCNQIMNSNKSQMNSTNESVWIIDSGATLHMCNSSKFLSNFISKLGHKVIISDGSTIPIHGYGTLTIFLKNDYSDSSHKLILNNVAVVPKLAVNLISVRALASLGVSLNFTQHSCHIQHPQANILLATISNSSYILKLSKFFKRESKMLNTAMTCIHEWHRKLGHRNIDHINKIKNTLNIKIKKCNCQPDCVGCLKGKLHALPFPQTSEKPSQPRDVITTDVCGPFRTISIGGSRYFVTFTCASTDYTEVAAIKVKSDCKIELMNFIKRCKNQFGKYPKVIRSDRGGEYLDQELQSFLNSSGIVFQCTVPRCPQQNGISERKNRTLLEAIRTMLMMKNLNKNLWAEALHHANNTFNNIPKQSDSPSPKEMFFQKSFNFSFIEFGAPVFHTTNPQNRSKLDERGSPGIFLGIDQLSKGFRILTGGKIRIERHVKFIKQITNSKEIIENEISPDQFSDEISKSVTVDSELANKPRRSERIRAKQANTASLPQAQYEPKTYKQAISCEDKEKWKMAMESELRSIENNNTWSSVELPKDRSAIGCRWVFKIKQGESEDSTRYKARLVAQGFTQKFGVDYDEVFAPVTRSSTFRTLLVIASARNLIVQQYDVKSAFLNGTLNEEIYIRPPPNYLDNNNVLRLHKSLYGLKQAARVWNKTLHTAMLNEKFTQSKYDECLYIYKDKTNVCYAIVHVDDMIFSSNSLATIQLKIQALNKSFELKCLGNVKNYLGIEVTRNEKGCFAISQSKYIQKVAIEFGLETSKGSKYPLVPGYHALEDSNMLESNNDYRKLIGMLLYISTNTRLDISAAVGILAQRVSKPRSLDYTEALRIVKYLVSTKDESLHMFNENETISLTAFADSDWAEDRQTRKSISGVICKVFGAPVSWSSRKQDIISTSTTESEFYALSEAVKEVQWLRNILKDFNVEVKEPIIINSDNQSTIKMVENSKFSSRTKHIDVRLHFVRECVNVGKIILNYCPSEENVADLLTKPLAGVKMKYLRNLAALYN